jgi:hypothetical protein
MQIVNQLVGGSVEGRKVCQMFERAQLKDNLSMSHEQASHMAKTIVN